MSGRPSRLRRLVLTLVGILVATGTLAVLSPTPAQAGNFDNGRLIAAIYNDSPFPLEYVGGWSQYGFNITPTSVAVEDGKHFALTGSVTPGSWPDLTDRTAFNGWFTYKVTVAHAGGITEYITVDIHGTAAHSRTPGWAPDVHPLIYVWQTSTPPPSTWRYTQGPPPNVLADPQFAYQHNVPYLYDQTITWDGEGPGDGVPTFVSLGDSTISGEGGRWAGNTNKTDGHDDAGSTSYWDTASGESITDCHRSKSALVHVGHPTRTHNLACSGAMTVSYDWEYPQGWRFKPGVDINCAGDVTKLDCPAGQKMGQLNELYHYARTHNVTNVVLAVGANDFDFSGVVRECMEIYIEQHFLDTGERCYNSGVIQDAISPANRTEQENNIYRSLTQLVATMTSAGYDKSMYSVILQNYWSAIPSDEDIRIPDDFYRRESEGGCPLLYGDASALNEVLLPGINGSVLNVARRFRATAGNPVLRFMDVSQALKGHRLCEKGAGLIENIPTSTPNFYGKGTDAGAADKVEWVTEARTPVSIIGTPYTLAEGGHANYWGQLAQRNCLIKLLSSNYPGGKCVPAVGGGVNSQGQPKMSLTSYTWW